MSYPMLFDMKLKDYGLSVSVKCRSLDSSPNQADLREALDKLIRAAGSWDRVDIRIKSEDV